MDEPLSLVNARKLIASHIRVTIEEIIPLEESLDRRPALNLTAEIAVPSFNQSTMDGYAISSKSLAGASPPLTLPIAGEIAAGCTQIPRLRRGEVLRIMTGGSVPAGADRVIPLEWCRETGESVTILRFGEQRQHIRSIGTDLRQGGLIICRGDRITPFHLHLLATSGQTHVRVFSRPRISFLCTGSELVGKNPQHGQIISGNLPMLAGLIRQAGATPLPLGTAIDDTERISRKLQHKVPSDIIVTTGGMGPGKYDLMGQVLEKIGVEILYRSLKVRPGRATIFGIRGSTLFFSLPGPPPAVYLLFNELVRPSILAMQGKEGTPGKARAVLGMDIAVRKKGLLNLKIGITAVRSGRLWVRPASLTASANATILVPANRRQIRAGEEVTIHLH